MKKVTNKIKDIIKSKYFNYALAFILPILILFIVFCIKGVFFDGERLAFGDMQAQYMHMLVYFKNLILGKESIFYSISKGLGGDMYSTFTYYMISPLNLLVLLFKTKNIMQAIYLIILIKFGLSSLTMYTYLKYKNPNKKNIALLFALCYSLMAYSVNNYFCIMWFDAIYALPIVLLGLEKLVNNKNPKLYIFSLFYIVFTNYYMGYMVCIFSVIYFVYLLFMKYTKKDKKEIFDSVIRFSLSSLLAGLMACVVFFPSIIDVMKANRSHLDNNATTILLALKRLFIGSYTGENLLSYYEPNLYIGLIVMVLSVAFFFNNKHTDKEKYVVGSIVTLFILSIFVPKLDLLWHGFSYPIGYNYRFTYLFLSFFVILGFNEFSVITRTQKNSILGLALILGMFVFKDADTVYNWVCIGLIILYAIILFSNIKIRNIILAILILGELGFNTYLSVFDAKNETRYSEFVEKVVPNFDTDNTHRVAGDIYYGTNELTLTGLSTTKGFYSTMNDNISTFYSKMNMAGGPNYYDDQVQAPPIYSTLLGVKYIYSQDKNLNYDLVKEVETTLLKDDRKVKEPTYIYENKDALNLGYIVRSKEDIKGTNGFDYLNKLMKSYSGLDEDILIELKSGYNENLVDSKNIYMIWREDVSYMMINGIKYEGYMPDTYITIGNGFGTNDIDIKAYTKDDKETSNYLCYYMDLSRYYSAINNLKLYELKDIKINKNKIKGNIEIGYDATLALSVPYEEGWTVYVDGKKTEYSKLNEVFMAIDIKPGKHTIEMKYIPKSFILSLIISLSSIIMTYIYLHIKK